MDEYFLYKVSEYLGKETLKLRLVFKDVPFLKDISAFYNNRFDANINIDTDPSTYLRLADIIDHVSDHIICVAIHNPEFVSLRQVFRIIHKTNLVIKSPHDHIVKALFDRITEYEKHKRHSPSGSPDSRIYDEKLLKLGIDLKFRQLVSLAVPLGHIPPPYLFDDYAKYMDCDDVADVYYSKTKQNIDFPTVSTLFEALDKLDHFAYYKRPRIINTGIIIDGYIVNYHPRIDYTHKNKSKHERAILKAYLAGRLTYFRISPPYRPTTNKLLKRVLQKHKEILHSLNTTDRTYQQEVDRIIMYATPLETFIGICKYHQHHSNLRWRNILRENMYDALAKLNQDLCCIIEQNTYDLSEIY